MYLSKQDLKAKGFLSGYMYSPRTINMLKQRIALIVMAHPLPSCTVWKMESRVEAPTAQSRWRFEMWSFYHIVAYLQFLWSSPWLYLINRYSLIEALPLMWVLLQLGPLGLLQLQTWGNTNQCLSVGASLWTMSWSWRISRVWQMASCLAQWDVFPTHSNSFSWLGLLRDVELRTMDLVVAVPPEPEATVFRCVSLRIASRHVQLLCADCHTGSSIWSKSLQAA